MRYKAFSFDGWGINGNDMFKRRLATLTDQGQKIGVGQLFAHAPELLAHTKDYLALMQYHYGVTDDAITLRVKSLVNAIEGGK